MKFTKVEVKDRWIWAERSHCVRSETGCKFNHPTVTKTYVKILARCLSYADKNIIYPGVRNPIWHQVRDMCRAGLLNRYVASSGRKNKYYYKTTMKGVNLLMEALRNSQW